MNRRLNERGFQWQSGRTVDLRKKLTVGRQTFLIFLGAGLLPAQAPPEPITIDQAVQEALANNANLIAERMNVPLATARLVTARLRPNPVLTLDGDYLDALGTGFSPANGAGPTEAAGRVDFVFEGPGKRVGRIAVAQLDKSAAELSVLNAIR